MTAVGIFGLVLVTGPAFLMLRLCWAVFTAKDVEVGPW